MSEEYKGYTIKIQQEEEPENPLDWTTPEERGAWFVMSRKNYSLPNELDVFFDDFNSWREVANHFKKKGQVFKFIDWYEHSGVVLNIQDTDVPRDRWDSGIAGIVIANSIEELEDAFDNYKMYMEGDVWGYILEKDGEFIDSSWGIYGYDYAIDLAKDAVDYMTNPVQTQ